MIAVPITTAESAPGDVDRARQERHERDRGVHREARPAGVRRSPGRWNRRLGSAAAKSGSASAADERHGQVVVERRGQRLDERADERERQRHADRAGPMRPPPARAAAPAIQAARTPRRRRRRRRRPAKPAQPLRGFHGRRGPPSAWPTSEAMPSPKASMPQTAAAIHSRSRNTRTRRSTASG